MRQILGKRCWGASRLNTWRSGAAFISGKIRFGRWCWWVVGGWVKQSPPTATEQFRSTGANMCQAARIGLRQPSKPREKLGEAGEGINTSREFNWRSNFNIFLVPSVAPHVRTGPQGRWWGEEVGGADVNTSTGLTFPFLATLVAQTAASRTKWLSMSRHFLG